VQGDFTHLFAVHEVFAVEWPSNSPTGERHSDIWAVRPFWAGALLAAAAGLQQNPIMFEAAELGRRVSKEEFDRAEPDLQTALLVSQRQLRSAEIAVVIVVAGVEGAGKGEVVNRLNKWFDTRGMRTHAFWDETEEETQRPRYWRFWRRLPPRGTIGVLFGSWYSEPIVERAFGRISRGVFDDELQRIEAFERLLVEDGCLLVKLWFHLSAKAQQKRLKSDVKKGRITSPLLEKYAKRYGRFATASERAIRRTDTEMCPWQVIEASDRRCRDLSAGNAVLSAIQNRLRSESKKRAEISQRGDPGGSEDSDSILDSIELRASIEVERYEKLLDKYQRKLNALAWKAHDEQVNAVAVFEGWDAAGKGGVIRRVTQAVDARLYRAISVAAPTEEERDQQYLWRFWRHIPRAGYLTIYDRSWYGRVLVERVEGFATKSEWCRAYQEINEFEEQLVDHGVVLMKFWLHISADEQLRRFREREKIEWKKHKITDEDWRNREKWNDYKAAVDEMVARTSTEYAPWRLIAANDKCHARVEVLRVICQQIERALKRRG
jgi:polyphosphate:AMP phosphotransferase